MRRLMLLTCLLPMPILGQLEFSSPDVDVGIVAVGMQRLTTVQLHNAGPVAVQLLAVVSLHPTLSLPAPPVTAAARWLPAGGTLKFPAFLTLTQTGYQQAGLLARTVDDSAQALLSAQGISVFISEVLADPATGAAGDANDDGLRQTYGDEFIELHNDGPQAVDITGWQLSDDDATPVSRFAFPSATLPAGGFAVLFGGGTPQDIASPVFVDDGRIGDGLANAGDRLLLLTSTGDTMDVVDGGDLDAGVDWGQNQSVYRLRRQDPWQVHDALPEVTERFSPGRSAGPSAEPGPPANAAPGRVPATVLITEILADPATGLSGDANGDGVRHTYADEFVELYNVAGGAIDIGGWSLSDDDTPVTGRFRFPLGTVMAEGQRVVLFGGGTPIQANAFVDDGRIGNGLSNSGDVIILRDSTGDTVDVVLGHSWPADRAILRVPEDCLAQCNWQPHTDDGAFSPGTGRAGPVTAEPPVSGAIRISEILAAPASHNGDANGDGVVHSYEDEFVELHNSGTVPVDLADWQLSDDDSAEDRRFTFPPGTHLPAGEYAVLFGGGAPNSEHEFAFYDDGRIGNGLTNSGDTVVLLNAHGSTVSAVSFPATGGSGHSVAITANGELLDHGALPGRSAFSPGFARPVYNGFEADTLDVVLGRPPPEPVLYGLTATGREPVDADAVRWLALHSDILAFDGSRPIGRRSGETTAEAWLLGRVVARAPALVRHPSRVNSHPIFHSLPSSRAWTDGVFRYLPRVHDDEGTTLSFAPVWLPDWLELDPGTGALHGRAPPQAGVHRVALQVTDGQGGLAVQDVTVAVHERPRVRISEVLADPPAGLHGDANGDGIRQTWADEFVELTNDGPERVDVGDWLVSDRSGRRPHPLAEGEHILPGERLVIFGRDAGGRLGDGLGNLSDAVFVVDPAGPETLAVARYELSRRPAQSLIWSAGSVAPQLHSDWPGRLLLSPGQPTPSAVSLRLVPARLDLIQGESAGVVPMVTYDDGARAPLPTELTGQAKWLSTTPMVQVLKNRLLGRAPGRTQILVSFLGLSAQAEVTVRKPLAEQLVFAPAWKDMRVPTGTDLQFSVRHASGERLQHTWGIPGQASTAHGSQFTWRRSSAVSDTVQLQVRRGGGFWGQEELVTRHWRLNSNHPPHVQAPEQTRLLAGQAYTLSLQVADDDGDAVVVLLDRGPVGLQLAPRRHELQWTPAPSQVGRHEIQLRASDGRAVVTADFELQVEPTAAKLAPGVAKGTPEVDRPACVPRVAPNPFGDVLTVHLCRAPSASARLDIFDLRGRRVHRLAWPAGQQHLTWNGTDRSGRSVASGVYFLAIRPNAATDIGETVRQRALRLR